MLAPSALISNSTNSGWEGVLPTELEFYQSYDWCLNPYLSGSEALDHLGDEVEKLSTAPNDWQVAEIATNIFLLSCALLNCIDDSMRGAALQLPSKILATGVGRGANRFVETISHGLWSQRRFARCRDCCLSDLNAFLSASIVQQTIDRKRLATLGDGLTSRLASLLPQKLRSKRLAIPSPFSHLDLTPNDVLMLGDCFARRFPNRAQPILLVGLRTSGSYFSPLLRALLDTEGFHNVEILTIECTKGLGRWEEGKLKRLANRGYWALIVDDPPETNRTLLAALDVVMRAGFERSSVKFLAPTHPSKPSWFKTLPKESVITADPERWCKKELLSSEIIGVRLTEYFRHRNFVRVSVSTGPRAQQFNECLQSMTSSERGRRLKQIFEVQLETPTGEKQTKYVLAKSVGWGWLSYRAFLAGLRLTGYVPPILGLRDGILYMEWIARSTINLGERRAETIDAAASYVAARVRHLNLKPGSKAAMDVKRHNNGGRLLEKTLSRAYGGLIPGPLMRSRIGRQLREQQCRCPTLVDGNMHPNEWIWGPNRRLKTDYEHHGMGKTALNVIDPAYDLAETVMSFALAPKEESELIKRYIAESGDADVTRRLFLHKLLAGLWAMIQSREQLFERRGGEAQHECHQRFLNAWNFLTIQAARYCGSLCHRQENLTWHSPLVALDVDGVIDRRLFGFPCTTASGIDAISLLNAHEICIVLNTARSASEVKEYCEAYSLAGGVAEHGSYLWDAVNKREKVLISAEAARQLAELRASLQRIPGVFLDERHEYSIRAFAYRDQPQGLINNVIAAARGTSLGDGAMGPIPTPIVNQLLADLRLDQLVFWHSGIDTAIIANEVDKGTGLAALRDWVLGPDTETIAVGDDERDLAMFRVATRCYAPSNIRHQNQARLLGCQISAKSDQCGLHDIARKLVHPDGNYCERCSWGDTMAPRSDGLFLSLLQVADQSWAANLQKAMFNPTAFRILFR